MDFGDFEEHSFKVTGSSLGFGKELSESHQKMKQLSVRGF